MEIKGASRPRRRGNVTERIKSTFVQQLSSTAPMGMTGGWSWAERWSSITMVRLKELGRAGTAGELLGTEQISDSWNVVGWSTCLKFSSPGTSVWAATLSAVEVRVTPALVQNDSQIFLVLILEISWCYLNKSIWMAIYSNLFHINFTWQPWWYWQRKIPTFSLWGSLTLQDSPCLRKIVLHKKRKS